MLDLQEYGVTKKWVIISESSKEVENNNIARLNAYSKQYVPRRNGGATIVCKRADDVQNVQTTSRTTFLNLTPVCAYTLVLCWNKNEKGNSRASYACKRAGDASSRGPIFFIWSGEEVSEGRRRPDFFGLRILDFLSCLLPTLWGYDMSFFLVCFLTSGTCPKPKLFQTLVLTFLQSLHWLLRRCCSQMPDPPHGLHLLLILLCPTRRIRCTCFLAFFCFWVSP